MRLLTRRTLQEFWRLHADAETPLRAWVQEALRADWRTSGELKGSYVTASIIDSERVVFNIAGNKYRLVVRVVFAKRLVFVKFIGTHAEYDAIGATKL